MNVALNSKQNKGLQHVSLIREAYGCAAKCELARKKLENLQNFRISGFLFIGVAKPSGDITVKHGY